MSTFNNDDYVSGQVEKQVNRTTSTYKIDLNSQSYPEIQLDEYVLDNDIETIQDHIKMGKFTYLDLCKYYLNRIHQNKDLNAVLELNDQALAFAEAAYYDDQHSMIYGMPILIKGNIATKDMHTTAGVAALKEFVCDDDAEIIKEIQEQGGIILGKTNLSEWANFMSSASSNGYSALGGQTINPYGPFDVGGSSSGSGASAAINLAALTIGTETAGSIIYPSSQNSIVGLKPTLGRVPQDRIIPISETHDTAGPMTKCVKDAYHLLGAMTSVSSVTFEKNGLNNIRVGIVCNGSIQESYRKGDPEILEAVSKVLTTLGCSVEDYEFNDKAFDTQVYPILKHEFKKGVEAFLSYSRGPFEYINLEEIMNFNNEDLKDRAPFNQEIIEQSVKEVYSDDLIETYIKKNQKVTRESLDEAFEEYDVLVTLSNYCTSIYAPAGYPALTIPAGYRSTGEPIGVTFIGKHHEDEQLLLYGYAFEQGTLHRKQPRR